MIPMHAPRTQPQGGIVNRRKTLSRSFVISGSLLGAVTFFASDAVAQASKADSAAIAGVVTSFHRMLASADTIGVMGLLAPEVLIIEGGAIETRDEYRTHHLAADFAATAANPSLTTITRVTAAGDQAWVVSTSTGKRDVRGQTMESISVELMVLRRLNGNWAIAALDWSSRTRRIPAPGGANPAREG